MTLRQFSIAIVTSLLSIVALAAFLQSRGVFTDWFPLGPRFDWLVSLYRVELPKHFPLSWVYFFADYISSGVTYVIGLFGFRLSLRQDWKDIISPLMLYFTTNAVVNWKANQRRMDDRAYHGPRDAESLAQLKMRTAQRVRGRKIFAVALGLWGFGIALIVAISSGLRLTGNALLPLIAVAVWLVVYECGSNFGVARLVGYEGQSWQQSFKHHFVRTQLNAIIGATVCLIAGLVYFLNSGLSDGLVAIFIAGYIMILAVRDVLNSWRITQQETKGIGATLKMLKSRAEFRVGSGVLVVFWGMVIAIIAQI